MHYLRSRFLEARCIRFVNLLRQSSLYLASVTCNSHKRIELLRRTHTDSTQVSPLAWHT